MTLQDFMRSLSGFPAYVYDLDGLCGHVASIKDVLGPELFYAAKANPDPAILRTLAPHVDGVEVASGGELTHVRDTLPTARLAFGGPGKTDDELALALDLDVERIHVESPRELARLAALKRPAHILLRANLKLPTTGAALQMCGPFGMDEQALDACARTIADSPHLTLHGVHAHLASGLDATATLALAERVLDWALPWLEAHNVEAPEINLGGGMAVDYHSPESRFDWKVYAAGLPDTQARLRIEPGRALTAYHGWYVTDVLDVKTTHGETYIVLRGGTHHLRTPATKGHDQPFTVLTGATGDLHPATLVGQLCTPKDVLARDVPVPAGLHPGALIAFAMAGAYAWNISHHDFLMHPEPQFHYRRIKPHITGSGRVGTGTSADEDRCGAFLARSRADDGEPRTAGAQGGVGRGGAASRPARPGGADAARVPAVRAGSGDGRGDGGAALPRPDGADR